jgi:hypothetical protein
MAEIKKLNDAIYIMYMTLIQIKNIRQGNTIKGKQSLYTTNTIPAAMKEYVNFCR